MNVKRIIKGIRKTSPFYDSLIKEAGLLKILKHPQIPEIFDLEEDDEYFYIIEEYIAGESLKALCNLRALSEKEIFHFILQIGNIIDYLHSLPNRIIYLDMKPENIIISEGNCYLVDFGSARHQNDMRSRNFGTRSYASPEQKNGEVLTQSSDIYSIGKLLEYLIDHSNISPRNEKALRRIVARSSENKRWKRICSMKEFLAHIRRIRKMQIKFSDKPMKIAFAGAADNTGVTYLSLIFSGYINSLGRKCIWAEANDTEAWYSLSKDVVNFRALAGLEMISRKNYENNDYTDMDIIADYGTLVKEMPSDFYDSDVVCIVVGNRVWETEEVKKARALSRKCRKQVFIVTPTWDPQRETVKAIGEKKYIAIPFIADFDSIIKQEEVRAVFYELAVMTGIICT